MKKFLLFVFLLLNTFIVVANNIRVTNVSLFNQDKANNTWQVRFDIAWDNSWRTSSNESNWDAAWVFIKYRPLYSTQWTHAYIKVNGYVLPSGADIAVKTVGSPAKGVGAILYRNDDGIGNISFQNIELKWSYGNQLADNDKVEISVHAIEMVYVPAGGFSVGDGSIHNSWGFKDAGTANSPFTIQSENEMCLSSTGLGCLSARNEEGGSPQDDFLNFPKILPAAFPKGYAAFYSMKYECSMGQYVDFLNNIPASYADACWPANNSYGNTITRTGSTYSTTTPDRACNFLNYSSEVIYADWSGLRPMTELEYEKVCRGGNLPVAGEYASGIFSYGTLQDSTDIINAGTPSENFGIVPAGAKLISFDKFQRPLRCGLLAGTFTTTGTRTATNGSFYGIMDLSGNLGEIVVGISTQEQRNFYRAESDGVIDDGNGNGYIYGTGRATYRGSFIRTVSDREPPLSLFDVYDKIQYVGFRCVIDL